MKPVRIGIVGFGTVGRAVAQIITAQAGEIQERSGVFLQVSKVCRRSSVAASEVPPGAHAVTDWKQVVHAEDVDLVVESIGGTSVAREVVQASLESGKPVVTANKNLIAESGDKLFALAAKKGLPIGIEATVAGGI